jgi:hypothetical protein
MMKTQLPVNQISEGQRGSVELAVEPDAKVVQADFGRQTSLKARQVMRPFPIQAKGVEQFVIDRFNDLSDTGKPAPQRFGPARTMTGGMGSGNDLRQLGQGSPSWFASKALIGHILRQRRQPRAGQARSGAKPSAKQRLSQSFIVGRGGPKPEPVMTPEGVTESKR